MASINVFRGSDQHRGWFHSSLLGLVEIEVEHLESIFHGFVVDGKGLKMSKSLECYCTRGYTKKIWSRYFKNLAASSNYAEDLRIDYLYLINTQSYQNKKYF